MGLCASKPSYIASSAGGEREYQERYLESKTLGQGEFGVVKLVHDTQCKDLIGAKPYAVKYLKKGYTFKDNTLYSPLKKHVLQGEVEILRRLGGRRYNLKLVSVYESPSMIYMVTEYCEGGEMVPWVSRAFGGAGEGDVKGGLRTEDVSRVAYQLWSAVDHCARNHVIHRDIKPENIMFATPDRNSDLRLIDFGSGTLDDLEGPENQENSNPNNGGDEVDRHHTFAGSAFYISPEMFQRTYTSRTDVWSAGATLYVLVAGYPSERLQETFNVLQSTKQKRLRGLPNLPENMPESFYDMLEGALSYYHKQRADAGTLMNGEFAQFHIHHKEAGGADEGGGPISIHQVAAEAAELGDAVPEMADTSVSRRRTASVVLEGSVTRHSAYLGYQKFERSLTTVLATMLSKETCKALLQALREEHKRADLVPVDSDHGSEKKEEDGGSAYGSVDPRDGANAKANAEKLQVVTVKALLEVLDGMQVEDRREVQEVMVMIQSLANFRLYQNFAYHISLLRMFVAIHAKKGGGGSGSGGRGLGDGSADNSVRSVHGTGIWKGLAKKRGLDFSGHRKEEGMLDSSVKSTSSFKGMRRTATATGSLHGMAQSRGL